MSAEVEVIEASSELVAHQERPELDADLIKRTVAKGTSDDELKLFLAVCERTGLDPFAKQIHAVMRWDGREGREVMSIQTSIDGYRLIADRTGKYVGQLPAQWCGDDGEWKDVWLDATPPRAAKVSVLRSDFAEPVTSVALWSEYVQTTKDGKPNRTWRTLATVMISKCAESAALRKAFPAEMSGVYTKEEMAQADNGTTALDADVTDVDALPAVILPTNAELAEWAVARTEYEAIGGDAADVERRLLEKAGVARLEDVPAQRLVHATEHLTNLILQQLRDDQAQGTDDAHDAIDATEAGE